MADYALSLNGVRANRGRLRVPAAGVWFLDLRLDGTTVPTGAAVAKIGSLTLRGTILDRFSGVFANEVRVRLIAGAGGWSKPIPAKAYHNDAGVRRSEVLTGLAAAVGETIDTSGDVLRFAPDFVRRAEDASAALDRVLGSTSWRVDYDGVTRYSPRPAAALASSAEVLEADIGECVLTITGRDPGDVPIGAVISDPRLGGTFTIEELDVDFGASAVRVYAWGSH